MASCVGLRSGDTKQVKSKQQAEVQAVIFRSCTAVVSKIVLRFQLPESESPGSIVPLVYLAHRTTSCL